MIGRFLFLNSRESSRFCTKGVDLCVMNKTVVIVGVAVVATLVVFSGLWHFGVFDSKYSVDLKNGLEGKETPEGDKVYTKTTDYYHIDVRYPATAGISKTAGKENDQAAVIAMELAIMQSVADFTSLQDFENLSEQEKQLLGFADGRKYELGASYTKNESPNTASFVFAFYEDTGGAHPNGYFRTFVWKKEGGKIELSDLFVPQSEYLERLSQVSKIQIRQAIGRMGEGSSSLFEEGYAPREQNFQNFYLHEGELVILFDPYQVAAYAAGPQVVRIPLTELRDILKSEFK